MNLILRFLQVAKPPRCPAEGQCISWTLQRVSSLAGDRDILLVADCQHVIRYLQDQQSGISWRAAVSLDPCLWDCNKFSNISFWLVPRCLNFTAHELAALGHSSTVETLVFSNSKIQRDLHTNLASAFVVITSENDPRKQVDTSILELSREDAKRFPYITSMGLYVFKTDVLLDLLRDCQVKHSIVGVRSRLEYGVEMKKVEEAERPSEGFYIRYSITVVLKNSTIPDETII
ncbi:hypothetical protein GIB67_001944 [Kingdonia uniflora]|uniref:glucose-1-phosphate adenylyltransferase n=1 Tax=Kingdonia uniflora TaxID=39325 RepID=A0A7J7NVP6_9MAGN|nr:hypothetical protein GIB67_001944 [Kingdonia uniflora]